MTEPADWKNKWAAIQSIDWLIIWLIDKPMNDWMSVWLIGCSKIEWIILDESYDTHWMQ